MRIASPVLVSAPRLACSPSDSDWNFQRMSMLWSKPPAAKTTPRRAVTVISRPSCSTTAPVTLAPSVVNRTKPGFRPDSDAGAQYTGEQSGGQRLTARGVAAAEQQATDPLAKPLGDERQALAGYPGHQVHPPVVRTRGRHGDRRLHHSGAQSRPVLTEHRRVERFALACPAGGASSRVLRVVIGVVPRPHEPQRRGAPQHLHRLPEMCEEFRGPLSGCGACHDRIQIGPRLRHGVTRAVLVEDRTRRQPQRAAGPGRGSADVRRLLRDQHLQTTLCSCQRRGHARAGADHQQIHGGVADS